MVLGRFVGWLFLLFAFFIASAEAVVAVGTGEYVGIATSDVITLITGFTPQTEVSFASSLIFSPAWVLIALVGGVLAFVCRKKKCKSIFS